MWGRRSAYLIYVGAETVLISFIWGTSKGLLSLIGALSQSHRFQDPHDSNDLKFEVFLKVPQLVHIRCFWSPVKGDWTAYRTHLKQLIYLGAFSWGLSRVSVLDHPYVSVKILFFA
jgi:hypothetical protein